MKVVGSGSPMMLTVRFKPREIRLLRAQLEARQRSLLSSIADTQRWLEERACGLREHEREQELERLKDDLVVVTSLLDESRRPADPGQPRIVTGPTKVMAEVIRGAAGEAADLLQEAVDRFREDRGTPTPQALRQQLGDTAAWVETLIGLDHADNHGVH